MVNSEFRILVTAKANTRKIMIMMYVIGHAKRPKELLEYKVALRAGKSDHKQFGP